VFLYFLSGPLMLLIPCAGFGIYTALRQRRTALYYALAWSLTLILVYATILPSTTDYRCRWCFICRLGRGLGFTFRNMSESTHQGDLDHCRMILPLWPWRIHFALPVKLLNGIMPMRRTG
jgi:hypothetical protein